MGIVTLVLFGAIAAAIYIVINYNKLKVLAEGVAEALSNILVSMQKRADLANKLQEIASTYAKDEQFTMISIAKDDSVGRIVDAYGDSLRAISLVNSVAQRYPQIKADALYQNLMSQLGMLENELQQKREAYNAWVRGYNTPLKQIPTVLYAPSLGLDAAPYWQSDDPEALNKLKEFKTDDERVRALAAKMGGEVKKGATVVGNGAANLSRQGVAVVRTKVEQNRAAKQDKLEDPSAEAVHESSAEAAVSE